MISFLGQATIDVALVLAIAGALVGVMGDRLGLAGRWERRLAITVMLAVAAAVGLMEWALISHDFSVKFVADVGSRETPLYYTIISLWGALEGSILFWAFLLSLYTVVFALSVPDGPLYRRTAGVLMGISSFFLFVIAVPGNPFARLDHPPADGAGPNALLQNNWMMGVHPPLLYLGYVGLSVPFAIVMASLIGGIPSAATFRLIRRWALVPWIFLTLGIVGGMWWSYAVLGWGGYWSWDPVENASIMPWLVATAFLHSLQVQERRQMLKTWTLSLIVTAFLLSVLGTFLTRSGVVISVHAFTQSSVGPVFLTFFGVMLMGALALLVFRSRALASPGVLEAAICRETAFLVNNLLFVAVTFTILLGTLFPLIAEALQGSQLSVGGPYFNHVAVPIGFAILFLMGVGPVLPWGAARLEELQYRLLGPVVCAVALIMLLLAAGVRGVGPIVTFGTAAFVFAVTAGRVLSDVSARRASTKEAWPVAARRLFGANPRRYGGYLAHIGVLLAITGIAGSQAYQVRKTASVRPGQTVSIDGYIVNYQGWTPQPQSNRMVALGTVDVRRGGQSLGMLHPSVNFYLAGQPAVVTPAVREEPMDLVTGIFTGDNPLPDLDQIFLGRNPFEDVYVTLESVSSRPGGVVTVQVLVNPLVGFIWLGGMLAGLGGLAALAPARRRRRVMAKAPEPVRLVPEEMTV